MSGLSSYLVYPLLYYVRLLFPRWRCYMAFKMPGSDSVRPHKAGELKANWNPELPPVTQYQNEQVRPDWDEVRTGRPAPTRSKTATELEEEGWIGLYLKVDKPLPPDAQVVDTPSWMLEPAPERAIDSTHFLA